jgi:hypothetical protein
MVINTTFNNISVLLVEETGVPGKNHSPAATNNKCVASEVTEKSWTGIKT